MKRNYRVIHMLLVLALAIVSGAGSLALAEADAAQIVFSEAGVTVAGGGAVAEGTTVTIQAAGSYTLTGSCSQGQVIVDADGDVGLILDGLMLASADGPAIDIRQADTVTLTLADGTQSSLSDGATYQTATDGQDAAIFSRADLVIDGDGALTVHALYNDGIASRDTLRIEGGSITVRAKNHGIKGKDYLVVQGGVLDVVAGGDGIKATNDAQLGMGYVRIDGGTLSIQAEDDGISAISLVEIGEGEITIDTGNNGMKSEDAIRVLSGTITIYTADDDFVCQTKEISPDAIVTVLDRAP